MVMNKNINVIDFFCGCGGTSAGLEKSGMNIVAGVDIDKNALATYAHNFPKAVAIDKSICDLACKDLESLTSIDKNEVLVFSACAPCQPFSNQNRNKRDDDERRTLLDEFHRFVEYFEPDFIILENVPGMQKVQEGPFTRFTAFLDTLGYCYDTDVKNAMDYGVPQSRKRLVLIASKHGMIKLPVETHGEDKIPYKTVRDTITKYPSLKAGEEHSEITNHRARFVSDLNLKRLKATPEGGDRRHWPDDLILECHKNTKGFSNVYGRMSWDKPSPTLTTNCTAISSGRYGHPSQDRAISIREAGALQTFDDDFIFTGSVQNASRQVGNAVPVLFAKALGDSVVQQINKKGKINVR